MLEIEDDGKIWLQGTFSPEYGVRVGGLFFVIGKNESEQCNCFIYKNYLVADLQSPENKYRTLKRFPLNLKPRSHGTLFNGFTKTKHADIMAVTYQDLEVSEVQLEKGLHLAISYSATDIIELMRLANWI